MFNFEELDAGTSAAEIFTQPTSEETTQENEPNTSWTWRCLTCDSGECSWADGGWRCSQCGSTKFYRTNAAVEKNNEQGIWRFLPFGAEGVQPSRSRRRRRRRANGPDPSDPFGFDLGETAESEVMTNDPEIDPEDDMARGPQGRSGRPLHVPPPPQPRSGQEGPRALLHGKGKGRQPSDGGSAGSSDGQLLSALRKLVAKKDDDSEWSAMSGPQRGVRWRGGAPPLPPTWRYDKDDLRAYTKFVKKVEIWKLQVAPYMSKKEMALSLYNSLQGEAEQELEHTPIEDLYVDDGVAKILEALKGPMEQKVVYQKRKFLSEFENLRRYAGESMRSYVNRFRRTQRCLKSVGVDVALTYDSESMGARLLDRSGLSQEGQRLVLVGTQQRLDFEMVVESMMLQYPEFRAAPPVVTRDGNVVAPKTGSKGGGKFSSKHSTSMSTSTGSSSSSSMSSGKGFNGPRRQVRFTEEAAPDNDDGEEFLDAIDEGDEDDGAADLDQPDDEQDQEQDGDDDQAADLSELAQVLTLTAKKLSSLTLGRKFSGRPPSSKGKGKSSSSSSMADRKKVTHCTACGALGHWHEDPECPLNQGGSQKPRQKGPQQTSSQPSSTTSKTHKVGILHHEHGATEVTTSPTTSYGNMFTINMIRHVPQQPHEINEVKISGPEMFAGYMVLDTGCQRTCCGLEWSEAHTALLCDVGLHPKMMEFPDSFKFGKGTPSHSTQKGYYPSAIGGQPLVLAASTLNEKIPFLASNSLLTGLGAVFNLVSDSIVFTRLGGAKAKICRLGGHMAIEIADFQVDVPADMSVWEEFSKQVDWNNPPPEFALSSQTRDVGLSNVTFYLSNDPSPADMVESLESFDPTPQVPHEGDDRKDDDGGQLGIDASRCSPGTPTYGRCEGEPSDLQSQQVPSVRQCPRSVRRLPAVRPQVGLERQGEEVGGQGAERYPENWIKRTLYGIAALAGTLLSNNCSFLPSGSSSNLQDQAYAFQEGIRSTQCPYNAPGGTLDQLLRDGSSSGSPLREPVPGSLQRDGAGTSIRPRAPELLRDGLLQRRDLQGRPPQDAARGRSEEMGTPGGAGRGEHRGRRHLRLGGCGFEAMKSGKTKRMRGNWLRSAKVLEAEHNIYMSMRAVKDRPPPTMDLWELFGGRALCSELAHQYDLSALQPWDLIYGYDFMKPSTRNEAIQALDRFKPLLVMLEIDCRHYTIFNRNLNYSSRLEEWEELQEQDRPLRSFTTLVARRQLQAGRYFLIENPERSELWSMPDMVRLASMDGVYSFSLDAGAFGATIKGKPVIKTFKLLTNLPDLDQALLRRLAPEDRALCTPIEGSATRASQEYPEEMCRALLLHLRGVARTFDPARFGELHQALPVQIPTQDLSQWDDIVENIEKSFENTNKRPYYITVDTALGKRIQDLMRIDAIRIQVVANPTTRRIPANVDEYYTRASFLVFNDDSRAVEIEDLGELQYPRQHFLKPVRYAVFAYGHRRSMPETSSSTAPTLSPTTVPGLPTDIDFPGLSSEISSDIRSSVARLHLNLGHPSRQELCRLLAYEGNLPDAVYECAKKLRCATCERLRPKQPPRPSAKPSLVVGQFGDELQMDIFYCGTLSSETFMVLGMVDRATGFHQAIIMPDRSGDATFQCLEQVWLRPYGLPIHITCDPDRSFHGGFQERVQALGILLEHCAPEAHHQIGMVERRNALLRTILEKLVDQFTAATIDECSMLLAAACHAINTGIHTHGRSAYQAVFGRQPRLPDSNFNDPMVLSSSSPVAELDSGNSAAYKAEFVRCEALKTLHELDCSQHLRRALLRKTRATKVADLQPGQPCAYWRWTRRGAKKRGSWKMGRFLSWDPSHVGKQAWVRTGGSTTLVTAEQLRGAFGFEDWTPAPEDIRALKDAAHRFDALLDDRGAPPEEQPLDDEDIQAMEELNPEPLALTPSMMVPVTPPELRSSAQPSTPPLQPSFVPERPPSLPPMQSQHTQVQQHQTINNYIESPTNITTTNQVVQQQYHRFGTPPRQTRRYRSRTPPSQRIGVPTSEQQRQLLPEQQEQAGETTPLLQLEQQDATSPPTAQQQPVSQQADGPSLLQDPAEGQLPEVIDLLNDDNDETIGVAHQTEEPAGEAAESSASVSRPQHFAVEDPYLPQLPQKRPFETLFTLVADEFGNITKPHSHWDGSPWIGYGPHFKKFHYAYLTSQQRHRDVQGQEKEAGESDTTQGSDTEESADEEKTKVPVYKQGMSRMELKALDREIPWRKILEMPDSYIDKFLEAIIKEAESWSSWQSVEPISDREAQEILRHPQKKKRVLKSRACYRDKALGQGELRPKCRVVALGHLDPDLPVLSRNSATPGRLAEHCLYAMIVAGHNRQLFNTTMAWTAWSGDAATAFLQGEQQRQEPLYLLPPSDGLIARTNTWQHRLYRVRGNIYGLANAPSTWNKEVEKRLTALHYQRHSFDKQLFYKVLDGHVVSMVVIYVDDFIGVHRCDYQVAELHNSFKWGSLAKMEVGTPTIFNNKELHLLRDQAGRYTMKITMTKFIQTLDVGQVQRGRLQQPPALTPSEQKELRSVSGCLQWAATQARPEIAPTVSLTPHGSEATIYDLKSLYGTIDFLKATPENGILIQDVAVNKNTVMVGYSDASWANAKKSGSQIGVVIGLTNQEALSEPSKFAVLDWKSSRSPRVCRSTLAAEASAGDEAADRSSFANLFLSELLYLEPAHKVGNQLAWVQATDAKSLYDAVLSENPNLSDKRTLVSIRAIQEVTSPDQMRWLPTRFQFADGLTKIDEKLMISFSKWMQNPMCILTEHPSNAALELEYFGKTFATSKDTQGSKQSTKKASVKITCKPFDMSEDH